MKPRTASASVAKCGMPRLLEARVGRVLAEPDGEDGLAAIGSLRGRASRSRRPLRRGRRRRRAPSARSAPGWRRSPGRRAALRARGIAAASASPMMSIGLARDQVGGRTASSALRDRLGESAASVPPRSIRRSTASTPMPPPLVRMARRLPGNGFCRPSVSARRRARRDRARAAARRGGRRRRRRHRTRRARRYGSRGLRALRMPARLDHHHRLRRVRRAPPT